ncbi:hypothetical protein [Gandjariella thermophila]|uniref:ESX-1 secretion-associated protein n=1 Tax=Gandjariella thermophila TaxID=1931992 RepID=A0A4D4JIC0_9PSEU|nr:hypothetical protein [Gandjariella thermophila]GDY34019.1 hypothetical protein GTS_56520 [Gandjariella thermophila]
MIGSFIPGLLQPLVDRASQVISAGSESVSQTGRMLQRTLEDYDQAESGATAGFRGLEEQL